MTKTEFIYRAFQHQARRAVRRAKAWDDRVYIRSGARRDTRSAAIYDVFRYTGLPLQVLLDTQANLK